MTIICKTNAVISYNERMNENFKVKKETVYNNIFVVVCDKKLM